ncbi:MAG: hypothetical protein ACT443_04235 [Gemmatimonadota bacterium]
MTPTVQLDMREFNEALRQYVLVCQRELADILNKKLLFIVAKAWKATPRASRAEIESSLNVVGYKVRRSKKTGEIKRGSAMLGGGSAVYSIINARRARTGQKGLYGAEMAANARKFVGRRLRAIGALQRGWIGALKKLIAVTRQSEEQPGGPRVKNPGRARPATPGWNPVAEAEYDLALGRSGIAGKQDSIDPRVVAALQAAFNTETASMREYIARKMQTATDPFNAR